MDGESCCLEPGKLPRDHPVLGPGGTAAEPALPVSVEGLENEQLSLALVVCCYYISIGVFTLKYKILCEQADECFHVPTLWLHADQVIGHFSPQQPPPRATTILTFTTIDRFCLFFVLYISGIMRYVLSWVVSFTQHYYVICPYVVVIIIIRRIVISLSPRAWHMTSD